MFNVNSLKSAFKNSTDREIAEDLSSIKGLVGWVEFSPQGNVLTANDIFLEMMDFSAAEFHGLHHSTICSQTFINSPEYKNLWQSLLSGEVISGVFERYKKNGDIIYLNGFYFPVMGKEGKISRIINIVNNITSSHEELKNKEAIITAINKSMAVIEFTPEGQIISANENFLKLLEYHLDDIIGQHHRIFCYDNFYTDNPDFWKKIRNGNFFSGRFERHNSSGSRLWLEASYNPVRNSNGKIYKVIKMASDITSRVETARRIADIAVTTSEETSQITSNANDVLSETVQNSLFVNEQVEAASNIGRKLFDSAGNIKSIISTIRNITDQTNILALNAAIEAARAGDSGRGFAVVAGEVRRLAGSTSTATQKITDVIEENNRLINEMYHQLDEIKKIISSENQKITDLSRSFQEINSGVNEFSKVIHQLNA